MTEWIPSTHPDYIIDVDYNKVPTIFSNWLDTISHGGQADLSFEVLGSGDQWIELISSSEFATITQGNTVIRQIGDVVSRSGVDKVGFVLPSTQTNFRVKLTVVNGIETGVNILKVARCEFGGFCKPLEHDFCCAFGIFASQVCQSLKSNHNTRIKRFNN